MKFGRRETGKVVSYLPAKKSKFQISPGSPTWITPKIRQGQPQTMYTVLQISSKSVHFRWCYMRTCEHRQNGLLSVSNIRLKPSFKPNNNTYCAYDF